MKIENTIDPAWVRQHPLYPEWLRICVSGVRVHQPWRESAERFIRETLAELGKPPGVSRRDWKALWVPPSIAVSVEQRAGSMTAEEHVERLCEHAIRVTPDEIPPEIVALLPDTFRGILADIRNGKIPEDLKFCACWDCMAGVAGNRIGEITDDDRWGWS